MNNSKVSVAIAVFNEEENIPGCLKSAGYLADEIVVVDGNSQDNTAQLAKKHGAKLISTTNKPMFHINKNMAIDNCHNDWIFLLDADERISKELAQEIKEIVKSKPAQNGFWVNRANWFLGGYLSKGGAYPDAVIRLFRNGSGRLPEVNVHEQIAIDGNVGYLKSDLLHLADPNFSRYLSRANRYTTQTALEIEAQNPGKNPFVIIKFMLLKPALTFLKIYFRHRGYVDGFRGFIWALFSAFHYFYAYAKYWQKSQKIHGN